MAKYTGIHTDDQIKLAQLGLIKLAERQHARLADDAVAEQRRRDDNAMRRREKHIVTRQRMIHGRQGPQIERDYLAVNEAGNLIATEFGHEAKKFDDVYEASALASRAARETGGQLAGLAGVSLELGSSAAVQSRAGIGEVTVAYQMTPSEEAGGLPNWPLQSTTAAAGFLGRAALTGQGLARGSSDHRTRRIVFPNIHPHPGTGQGHARG